MGEVETLSDAVVDALAQFRVSDTASLEDIQEAVDIAENRLLAVVDDPGDTDRYVAWASARLVDIVTEHEEALKGEQETAEQLRRQVASLEQQLETAEQLAAEED